MLPRHLTEFLSYHSIHFLDRVSYIGIPHRQEHQCSPQPLENKRFGGEGGEEECNVYSQLTKTNSSFAHRSPSYTTLHAPGRDGAEYVFCAQATIDSKTREQTPCSNQSHDDSQSWFDFDNPCSSSACLVSTKCSAGGCRLEQLSGRWRCCQCKRGGNSYTYCQQRMRSSPDTFCYHVCCGSCDADPVSRRR